MTNPNDPAFVPCQLKNGEISQPLTKREYFAAMMMNATSESIIAFHNYDKKNQEATSHIMAAYWVCMADALIKELSK